ncbi:hypothetical protein BDY19DRAFT_107787 [Irpex rosettiformis]|uniref:Uncharacterized protein n=1 Tax=Irpex rosettiformis TaxID=378272 RepID=A0ACB8U5A7_9APHY|nr:hypothetical protein BDY19DRAFT_107787 [Irpex rosettiformis]
MPTNAVRKHSSRLTGEPSSAKATVAMTQPGKDASGKTHGLLSAPASTRAPNKSNAAGGCAEGTKEHPSMTSPSNTESKTEKQPSNSINSDNNHGGKGRRGRRNAKQNSGNEVSAAGLSTTVEPSTAKSETIPPVSQKKSQSRRKAEPKPSSCETLTSTDVPRAPPTDVKKEPVLTASLASSLPPKVSPQTAPIAHRNNTVRLASTRQKPRQECIDFILGRCQKGDECQRLHLPHDSSEMPKAPSS